MTLKEPKLILKALMTDQLGFITSIYFLSPLIIFFLLKGEDLTYSIDETVDYGSRLKIHLRPSCLMEFKVGLDFGTKINTN